MCMGSTLQQRHYLLLESALHSVHVSQPIEDLGCTIKTVSSSVSSRPSPPLLLLPLQFVLVLIHQLHEHFPFSCMQAMQSDPRVMQLVQELGHTIDSLSWQICSCFILQSADRILFFIFSLLINFFFSLACRQCSQTLELRNLSRSWDAQWKHLQKKKKSLSCPQCWFWTR